MLHGRYGALSPVCRNWGLLEQSWYYGTYVYGLFDMFDMPFGNIHAQCTKLPSCQTATFLCCSTNCAIRYIHCTHWKLSMQYWIANGLRMSLKLNVIERRTLSQSTGLSLSAQVLYRFSKKIWLPNVASSILIRKSIFVIACVLQFSYPQFCWVPWSVSPRWLRWYLSRTFSTWSTLSGGLP